MKRALLPSTFAFVALTFLSPAFAQNKATEGQARALQKKAMQEDYLATDFAKAEEKLTQAVAKCEGKCSTQLRAELRRDLGVVQIGGQIDREKGAGNWVEALKLDPTLQLDPDVKTKELEKIFEEAKGRASGAPQLGAAAGTAAAPSGDFKHTPAPEQAVRTPVPVYAEYGGSEQVVKVVVKYKGFGMPDWKTLELPRTGKGYGAQLPCADVVQGEMLYYLQGFNAQSDPVATSGDRNNPFRVAIKAKIDGEPPHLPGQAAPKQCAEASTDCPPDFPGCKKATSAAATPDDEDASKKDEGEDCDEGNECKSNACTSGKCSAPTKNFARVWIGVSGNFDFAFLGSATNVCKLDPQATPFGDSGYYCTKGDLDFPLRTNRDENDRVQLNNLNTITGGGAIGNVRVMVTFDYALSQSLLLGARVGYVFAGYTGNAARDEGKVFAPLHLEARGTWVFGARGLNAPVAPFVFLGGGVTEQSASLDVNVVVTGETPPRQTVKAWGLSGPGFVAPGGGVRFSVAEDKAGRRRLAFLVTPLRFQFAFGSNGLFTSWSPELGIQAGF